VEEQVKVKSTTSQGGGEGTQQRWYAKLENEEPVKARYNVRKGAKKYMGNADCM
jgi:hypothetical protein